MRLREHLFVLSLAALLTWLLFMGLSSHTPAVDASIRSLGAYAERQSELRSEVLSARAGMLRTYDPLVENLDAMRLHIAQLRRNARADADMPLVDALARSLAEQETLTEQFKTRNALAQNSVTYVSLFSARLSGIQGEARLRAAADSAWGAMMRLTLNTSAPVVLDAQRRLEELGRLCALDHCAPQAQGLLAHGQLLSAQLPEIDRVVQRLSAPAHRLAISRLAERLGEHQRLMERHTLQFRILLYVTSLLLLYLLGRWGMQLRLKSSALRQQVALEHAVAALSAGLIGATAETLPRAVSDGLATLCRSLGAIKAVYRSERLGELWSTTEANSPRCAEAAHETALALPDLAGVEDGAICFRLSDRQMPGSLREAMQQEGARSCLCLFAPGGRRTDMLMFALRDQNCTLDPELLPVVHTAYDAVALAVEQICAEQERAALEQQMRHARRMQMVGTFTSGVAHNFNNLLGAIVGNAEIAQVKFRRLGVSTENADEILLTAERGRELVDNLLAYGRRPDRQQRRVRLDRLVEEAVRMATVAMPSRRLVFKAGTDSARLLLDPVQMQQVVLNLCNNAGQATGDGATILVTTDVVELHEKRQHTHGMLSPGAYLRVRVRDSGAGMSAAVLARVFEPFYTTRPSGTGLGLATAQEIVRAAGGDILIETGVGAGTDAQIWLPHKDGEPSAGPEPIPAKTLRGAGETVLYLAASEQSRLAGEDLLAALGYEPVGFTDPDQMIRACRKQPDRFDAFLVEQVALAGRLSPDHRACLPPVRIVATSRPGEISQDAGALQGAAVIRLPLDALQLLTELHSRLNSATRDRVSVKSGQI